jgi:hypothetical protein
MGILTRGQLVEEGFQVGNSADPQADIKVSSRDQIDLLIDLIIRTLHKV